MQTRVSLGWPMTPVVKRILVVNAAVWLVVVILDLWLGFGGIVEHLGLVPERVYPGLEVWQPLTYMWLHSTRDPLHIVFNSLFLWMFGGSLEQAWGARGFLKFYLLCGIGAGVIVFITGLIFAPSIPVVGASGAIYGLVVAWAIVFPNKLIYIFGVFPMKGKYFALIPIGYALLDFFTQARGVSHAAHLGGMAVGALLVTGFWRPNKATRQLRYWWLRRKLKVIEGQKRKDTPPGGGYWN